MAVNRRFEDSFLSDLLFCLTAAKLVTVADLIRLDFFFMNIIKLTSRIIDVIEKKNPKI